MAATRKPPLYFNVREFLLFRGWIERESKWRYSGETDILLLDFEVTPTIGDCIVLWQAGFRFDRTITLHVEELVRSKRVGSVDGLIHELVQAARSGSKDGVWEISDRIRIERGRRSLWNYAKKKMLLGLDSVYDEMKPFAVCNLERPVRA